MDQEIQFPRPPVVTIVNPDGVSLADKLGITMERFVELNKHIPQSPTETGDLIETLSMIAENNNELVILIMAYSYMTTVKNGIDTLLNEITPSQ